MLGLSLIISLHDVAPETFDPVRRQLEALTALGVERTSLLAVPWRHGKNHLDQDPGLCHWLLECQKKGHEVVLHGWEHRIQNSKFKIQNSKTWATWFYQNLYTSHEGEFLDLEYDEARQLITQGLMSLRETGGLEISGFIPPAWLMNPNVERAAKDLDLLYTNTISHLIHLPSGKRFPTRSCVWSTRAHWRRLCSLGWNAFLFQQAANTEPLRISLHPCDLEYPAIWRQIEGLIGKALITRKATTYAEWMKNQEFKD